MPLDHLLREWVVAHRVHALDGVMWTLSAIGRGGMIWFAIGLAAAAWRKRWRDFVTLVLAVALAFTLADHVLKPLIGRERPFATSSVHVIGGKPDDASFPSGHAANSAAAALVMSATAPALTIVWWILALGIAYSRVYVGVHYPLDVAGGLLVGVASAALVLRLTRRYRR